MQKHLHQNLLIRTSFPSIQDGEELFKTELYNNRAGYILDTSCPSYKKTLAEGSRRGKFRFTYPWLIIHVHQKSAPESNIRSILNSIELRADMHMEIALYHAVNHFDVYQVFKLGTAVDMTINRIGDFVNGSLHYYQNRPSNYDLRKNLSGVLLRTGSTVKYSLETDKELAEEYRNRKHQTFERFDFTIFMNIQRIHQFRFNVTLQSAWFGNTSSGIDGGIARLLHERKIDISSSGGILRIGRIDFYDYLMPIYDFRTCYFFKNPGTVKPSTGVLKPFSQNAWYAVTGSGILMSAAIKLAFYAENRFLDSKIVHGFFTSFLITISIFAQQGSAILPTHLGCRLIVLNILIFSILLYNYYTSSLVSSLLSSKPTMLTTIRELYESNLKVGIEYQPYTITYIIQQKNDVYIQKLNSTKIYESGIPNFMAPEDGIAMVKKGGFAYHTTVDTAYPLLARTFDQESICDLAEIDFLTPGVVGFTLQKGSEYTELFQISLVMIRVRGIMKRAEHFWLTKKPECLLGSRVASVGVNELFLVYLVLFSGLIISLLILMVEIICFQWTTRKHVSK